MSGDLPGLSPTRGYDWQQWTPGPGLRSPWTAGHRTPGAGCRGREQSDKYWCQLPWRCSFLPHKPTMAMPSHLASCTLHVLRSSHHLQHSAAIWTFKTSVTTILFSFLRWQFMDCRTAPAQRQSSFCESCEPIEDLWITLNNIMEGKHWTRGTKERHCYVITSAVPAPLSCV